MSFSCFGCSELVVMVLNDSPKADTAGRPRLYIINPPTPVEVGTVAARLVGRRRYGLHPVWQGHRIPAGERAPEDYQLYSQHHCPPKDEGTPA